ncbi:possible surface protein [Glossina pallidipes salivary gland hypertrophy virus]|uniref:Possible surface protein n=1 Tax=Glossina hytrovirus (isolate Glossina pallidipes/Ethiopia/Seibersdorf/-) TaxID=379529 RepID=B0YLK9_GHVS|nr:possible surface protein [Glossina pallidipes salivary gland hypertrophy virus]ABQ08828.1 possible surface protein [Glossina pallidipes salivary gland hypertrophy virus]
MEGITTTCCDDINFSKIYEVKKIIKLLPNMLYDEQTNSMIINKISASEVNFLLNINYKYTDVKNLKLLFFFDDDTIQQNDWICSIFPNLEVVKIKDPTFKSKLDFTGKFFKHVNIKYKITKEELVTINCSNLTISLLEDYNYNILVDMNIFPHFLNLRKVNFLNKHQVELLSKSMFNSTHTNIIIDSAAKICNVMSTKNIIYIKSLNEIYCFNRFNHRDIKLLNQYSEYFIFKITNNDAFNYIVNNLSFTRPVVLYFNYFIPELIDSLLNVTVVVIFNTVTFYEYKLLLKLQTFSNIERIVVLNSEFIVGFNSETDELNFNRVEFRNCIKKAKDDVFICDPVDEKSKMSNGSVDLLDGEYVTYLCSKNIGYLGVSRVIIFNSNKVKNYHYNWINIIYPFAHDICIFDTNFSHSLYFNDKHINNLTVQYPFTKQEFSKMKCNNFYLQIHDDGTDYSYLLDSDDNIKNQLKIENAHLLPKKLLKALFMKMPQKLIIDKFDLVEYDNITEMTHFNQFTIYDPIYINGVKYDKFIYKQSTVIPTGSYLFLLVGDVSFFDDPLSIIDRFTQCIILIERCTIRCDQLFHLQYRERRNIYKVILQKCLIFGCYSYQFKDCDLLKFYNCSFEPLIFSGDD